MKHASTTQEMPEHLPPLPRQQWWHWEGDDSDSFICTYRHVALTVHFYHRIVP